MCRGVYHVMDISEIKQRLELALRPTEKPPTLEEVLEQVSRHGVLRGPVDWVFPAWMLYVEYATQKIAETFQLSEGRKTALDFRDTLKRLLLEAWMQAKEKLTAVQGRRRGHVQGGGEEAVRARRDVDICKRELHHIFSIRGVSAETYFPDLLKLPRERLELLQLGWRASDEGDESGRPVMNTTQPWQVFAWTATRYGELRIRVDSVNLTREGVSVDTWLQANSWRQKWSKAEAIDLVASHLRRGEWAPC